MLREFLRIVPIMFLFATNVQFQKLTLLRLLTSFLLEEGGAVPNLPWDGKANADLYRHPNKCHHYKNNYILDIKKSSSGKAELLATKSQDISDDQLEDTSMFAGEDNGIAGKSNSNKRRKRNAESGQPGSISTASSTENLQAKIDLQTKRMFYLLTGVNLVDTTSHLRITKLFQSSVRLVRMTCDPLFLNQVFLDKIEQGFLFLVKQQGFETVNDVDMEDFVMLHKALDFCMGNPEASITMEGNHCPADFHIESAQRSKVQAPFDKSDQGNFVWGKHDIVVDAAWHVVDITHGICFATFQENLNLHHKYQVVMEQLFRGMIHQRWNQVTQFNRDDLVDNVFTTSVNLSMLSMDMCAQGSYIGSVFLHRLRRPNPAVSTRKRRSVL